MPGPAGALGGAGVTNVSVGTVAHSKTVLGYGGRFNWTSAVKPLALPGRPNTKKFCLTPAESAGRAAPPFSNCAHGVPPTGRTAQAPSWDSSRSASVAARPRTPNAPLSPSALAKLAGIAE